jgi:hypothetical protein
MKHPLWKRVRVDRSEWPNLTPRREVPPSGAIVFVMSLIVIALFFRFGIDLS